MKTRTNHGAEITLGTREIPSVAPAATCSDSWEAITEEHAKITYWRDAWARAYDNRKAPWLAVVEEYINARWSRANRRMKRLMDRVDAYVQVKVCGRDGTVAIRREDIQEFWRCENCVMSKSNR